MIGTPTALIIAVTPGAAQAAGHTATVAPAGDGAAALAILNAWSRGWGPRAYAYLGVWSDHTKHVRVCDWDRLDGIGLAVQVDPSGPQAPIIYYDKTPEKDGCLEHDFWYSVRKFRWISVYQGGGVHGDDLPWIAEYPFPDF